MMSTIEDGISGAQIGVLPERELAGVEAPVRLMYDQALLELSALGVRLKEMRLPLPVAEYLNQGGDIMSVDSYAQLGTYVERSRDKVDPIIAGRILRGAGIAAADYYRVLEARGRHRRPLPSSCTASMPSSFPARICCQYSWKRWTRASLRTCLVGW
jgi:Asp-tRNA(Asn)/Glu-tRNA(Gln) amidotransferase A subunit family amidase